MVQEYQGVQSICKEYGAWSVSLPDRPPSVRETATLYPIDDNNSEVVAVQVVQSVDNLFVQPLRQKNLEHPSKYHVIKSSHIIIV